MANEFNDTNAIIDSNYSTIDSILNTGAISHLWQNAMHNNNDKNTTPTGSYNEDGIDLFDYVFFFFMPIMTLVGVTGNILVLVIGKNINNH